MSENSQKESVQKSRDLTVLQLFEILQEEYIVCELRSKIYPESIVTKDNKKVSPRNFWLEMMERKKDKILDIAQRHLLMSIFDDKFIFNSVKDRVIPEIGFPNFIYKDKLQKLQQEKWDIHNYYAVNSTVRVYKDGVQLKGTIDSVNFVTEKVRVKIGDDIQEFDIETITRVL